MDEFSLKDLRLKEMNKETANSFICRYHYSKSCPNIVVAIGEYYKDSLVNCIVFNYCCGREMAKQVLQNGSNENTLELARMVSLEPKPKNMESYCIAKAFDWLKKNMPNIKCIISYADNTMGHKGYCYQASGFSYYGQSRPTKEWYLDGKRVHERVLNSRYGTSSYEELYKILGDKIQYKINYETKSRYYHLIPQNKRERKELEKMVLVKNQPFPKGDNRRYDMDANGIFTALDEEKAKEKTKNVFVQQIDIFDILEGK